MAMTFAECTKVLDEYISPRLDQIGAVFLDPDVKVTLIVRTPSAPNGELVITSDDLDEVRKVLDRREAAGITRERDTSIDIRHVTKEPTVDLCETCGGQMTWKHDHKPDQTGLDDGPPLPGRAPRKKMVPKPADEVRDIRARAWATRREKYGRYGHK